MSCRLVKAYTVRGFFLNQQEFSITFNNGGNGSVWFPGHVLFTAKGLWRTGFYNAGRY
jgi:hypothetical protein